MGIKFNLIFNDIKIRNLAELKENFYIEDVLLCYKNERLIQWLEDRNLYNESKKIKGIDSNLYEFEIIKIIIEVLEIKFYQIKIIKNNKESETLIEDDSKILEYEEKIQELKNELKFKNSKIKSLEDEFILQEKSEEIIAPVIKSLLTKKIDSYIHLKNKIKVNDKELRTIRNIIKEIEINYFNDFNQDSNFFKEFQDFPLVIFAVLMNKNLREGFLEKFRSRLLNYFIFNYRGEFSINGFPVPSTFPYIRNYIKINYKNNEFIETGENLILGLGSNSKLWSLNKYHDSSRIKYDIIKDFILCSINQYNNNDIYVFYIKMD